MITMKGRYSTSTLRSRSFKSGIYLQLHGFKNLNLCLNNLTKNIHNTAVIGEIRAAKSFKRYWRKQVANGGAQFAFPPLNSDYMFRKLNYSSGDMFTLFGAYYKNIEVQWTKRGNVSVGVDKKAKIAPVKGIGGETNVSKYIGWIENGTNNIPARPLLAYSFKVWGGKNKIRSIVIKTIGSRALLSKTIQNIKV